MADGLLSTGYFENLILPENIITESCRITAKAAVVLTEKSDECHTA